LTSGSGEVEDVQVYNQTDNWQSEKLIELLELSAQLS
jgi:hypothetical protein